MKTLILFLFFISYSIEATADEAYPEWQLSQENGIGKFVKVYIKGNIIAGADLETIVPGRYMIRKYNPDGSVIWSHYGTCSGSKVNGLVLDSSGNIYTTGYCTENTEIYTMKLDSSGALQWYSAYSSTGNVNTIKKVGNFIYVCGYDIVNGNQDILLIKYDLNGNQIFSKTADILNSNEDAAYSTDIDFAGNIYIAGITYNPASGYDDFVLKYSSAGILLWNVSYGKTDSVDFACKIFYRNGYLYAGGTSNGAGNDNDCLIYKLNAGDGSGIWIRRYNGPVNGNDSLNDMKIDDYGDIYIACSGQNNVYTDIVTLKYNSDGIQQWEKRYLSNYFSSYARLLSIDNSQNIYVFGTDNIYANGKIPKYNPDGVRKYSGYYYGLCIGFPTLVCYNQYIRSMDIDNSGNLYLTGSERLDYTYTDIFVVGKILQVVSNVLHLKFNIEGFYDPGNDLSVPDTVNALMRKKDAPYEIVYSAKSKKDQNGDVSVNFNLNSNTGLNYYLILKHRNSIETWSSVSISFLKDSLNYDFTESDSRSYGSNMIRKGSEWAIYSGDVNQDDAIDLSDVTSVQYDMISFNGGYINSDVNGDYITDLNDIILTYKNKVSVISVVKP
ncbi:MAG TPA: hypothetical protein PKA90_16260 [Ignavibacteria bacterium]|nr:hypothetical protein [Ignavibacteria bacterium]HMR41971.1 hypothetical protein [Ignavibacteria bacterium]